MENSYQYVIKKKDSIKRDIFYNLQLLLSNNYWLTWGYNHNGTNGNNDSNFSFIALLLSGEISKM